MALERKSSRVDHPRRSPAPGVVARFARPSLPPSVQWPRARPLRQSRSSSSKPGQPKTSGLRARNRSGADLVRSVAILAQAISDRTTCCLRALWQVIQFLLLRHFPGKTLLHATPVMECDGSSNGWVQVLRGPRPNSVRWPMALGRRSSDQQQQGRTRGRWRQPSVGAQNATPPRRAPDPDAAMEVARSKFSSFEAALAAMGNHQGPEVDALRSALSKAKQAAKERPLKAQLAHTDAFIERSRLRVQKLDQERDAETELLNCNSQRRTRFGRVDWGKDVAVARRKRRGRFGVSHTFDKFDFAGCITHEDETVAAFSVVEHGGFVSAIRAPSSPYSCMEFVTADGFESFEQGVLVVHEEDVKSRYGLCGVRVGEASHPGPPRRHISRPIEGRDVIPRMHPTGATLVDEDSDVVDVTHVSQRSRRGRRRVSSDSDVPLVRGSRFAVLTESDDESDGEPLIRPTGQTKNEDDSPSIFRCCCRTFGNDQ